MQVQARDVRLASSKIAREGQAHIWVIVLAQDDGACSISEEGVQCLREAVLLDHSSSMTLPWLAVPDERFCSMLVALLPQDLAHRVACAAMSVLRLKLEALAAPATSVLAAAVVQIGALLFAWPFILHGRRLVTLVLGLKALCMHAHAQPRCTLRPWQSWCLPGCWRGRR